MSVDHERYLTTPATSGVWTRIQPQLVSIRTGLEYILFSPERRLFPVVRIEDEIVITILHKERRGLGGCES